MKIAHLGASGNVGSKILDEALRRGHTVTAIVRNPARLAAREGLTAVAGDANVPGSIAPHFAGHDVVISSVHFADVSPDKVIGPTQQAKVPRLMIVGGAGSLRGPDGVDIVDSAGFPDAYKPEALAARAFLNVLKGTTDLDWTYVSPSAMIAAGERTGKFRVGQDDLLIGEDGQSRISEEDFAIAFIDELESHAHPSQRITVGY